MRYRSLYIVLLALPITLIVIGVVYIHKLNDNALKGVLEAYSSSIIHNEPCARMNQDIVGTSLSKNISNKIKTALKGNHTPLKKPYLSYISLQPYAATNTPTPTEQKLLLKLIENKNINSLLLKQNNRMLYLYGIQSDKSCISCHQEEGLKAGDTRGALAVYFDSPDRSNLYYLLFLALGLLLVSVLFLRKFLNNMESKYYSLSKEANIDSLTGLHNKRAFFAYARQHYNNAKRNNGRLAIIICDIDFFKNYNDRYGHLEGDKCLQEVALAISNSPKRSLDLVYRFGGEEFIVVLPDTSLEGARVVAENIRQDIINLKILHEDSSVAHYVSISLGAASCLAHETYSYQEISDLADKALYRAKKSGRNRVQLAEVDRKR